MTNEQHRITRQLVLLLHAKGTNHKRLIAIAAPGPPQTLDYLQEEPKVVDSQR
eukprot:CAMPEP_0115691032 /NCGR_PEP_ID=MMETSP0272-20121206/62436_1 /TAXON_ID=71861 /ORGANISM="Scrippsiella trochoidea, Strain CCMP3099" /LENGTH=52 /DNA_ID=CAMNT_0003130977 /DNA_START=49 /DNA_END=203 /DNA_ORIENTATION=+